VKGVPIAELEVGAVVEGTVQRITPYGAFLQLEDGKVGLVHISEIDRNYVRNVEDHLHLNDRVQAKVVAIKEDGKIDLSIKALQDPAPRIDRRSGRDPEFEQNPPPSGCAWQRTVPGSERNPSEGGNQS
jgi:S1 RNA binding domain protein